jgi:hypothetical protein
MLESIRCLLLGHDDLYFRSFDRLKLRCLYCHRETPGWRLTHPDEPRQRTSRGPSTSALPSLTT